VNIYFQLITIKMVRCIVNSPPDNDNRASKSSLTPTSIFDRFKKQSYGSREFKRGSSPISFWGSKAHLSDPSLSSLISDAASIHNLIPTTNDHVDIAGASNDLHLGAANGYVFPKPANSFQGFKHFGIRFGKFGHLYGTGAFYSHREYPSDIR
jgi:hypothetical protein